MSLRYYLVWVSIVAAGNTALYILKKESVEESLSALMDFRDIRRIQIFDSFLTFSCWKSQSYRSQSIENSTSFLEDTEY